jgi:hypothetical protein
MESHCEELVELAEQAGNQIPAEAEAELLIDLEEEIGQRKETVGDLGRALKETVPEELKGRVEEAIQESVAIANRGSRYVDHVKTLLEFASKDSESSSYKGATGGGAAPGRWQTAAEELGEEDKSEDEAEEPRGVSSGGLLDIMRGVGHMQANDSGWPTFDGRYASYPQFKKEWKAYRETYHSAVNNDLAAKALRDKCIQGDALRMVSHLDDLQEIWETLDTCYERPEKYMEEVLRPIVEFRRYKITDCAAVREFYLLLRAAIKGAKGIRKLDLLINDQTVPKVMSRMPYTDWKEWATKRPDWMQENLASAFEKFVERKWQDALNIAATEPSSWGVEKEKISSSRGAQDKVTYVSRGMTKVTRVVNVVEREITPRSHSPSWDVSFGRKCRVRYLIGCNGDTSRSTPVQQVVGDEVEQEEGDTEEERAVLILPEACSRGGVLWAREFFEAQVHASWLRWGAHTRCAQAARGGERRSEPRRGGRVRVRRGRGVVGWHSQNGRGGRGRGGDPGGDR